MAPDFDDPNNHAPPVSPDDDWGDLDGDPEAPAAGQYRVRPDRGIPPRKQGVALRVKRHAPKLKQEDDGKPSFGESGKIPEKYGGDRGNPAPNLAKKATGKAVIKTVGNVAKKHPKKWDEKSAPDSVDNEEVPRIGEQPSAVATGVELKKSDTPTSLAADPERISRMYPKGSVEMREKAIRKGARTRKRSSRGERADWGMKDASGSLRWILYTGAAVVALIVTAVILDDPAGGEKSREKSVFSKLSPEKSDTGNKELDKAMMALLNDGQEDAKRIFAQYATAESTGDFIASIHRADRLAPLLEEKWVPLAVKSGWKPGDGAIWSLIEEEGSRHATLSGTLPDFSSYRAVFRWDEGDLTMDWKATIGYCSADFEDLKKGRGNGSEVRVLLSPADFHTFPLPEGEFRSYRLTSPDGRESIWGYTKVGGEIDSKLAALFILSQITGEARAQVSVILGMERGPEEALPTQWMINSLVRLNWLDE